MNKVRCIIIEDQAPAQRVLIHYIKDIDFLELVGVYNNSLSALEILNSEAIDLIFLDIHLPKMSGIEFLKSIMNPPRVILTTAFTDYAVQSYELDVLDYLVKPFSFERFIMAISKLHKENNEKERDSQDKQINFFIKSGFGFIKVSSIDILFIKSDMDYTEIHLFGNRILSKETLSNWQVTLKPYGFIQVHKSYIINNSHIKKVTGNEITTMNDKKVPFGRSFKESFFKVHIDLNKN